MRLIEVVVVVVLAHHVVNNHQMWWSGCIEIEVVVIVDAVDLEVMPAHLVVAVADDDVVNATELVNALDSVPQTVLVLVLAAETVLVLAHGFEIPVRLLMMVAASASEMTNGGCSEVLCHVEQQRHYGLHCSRQQGLSRPG